MSEIKLINSKFTKINGNRNPDFTGEIAIKTNFKIIDIKIIKTNYIEIKYNFEINYGKLGQIQIEGFIIVSTDQKTIENFKKSWENKNIQSSEYISIINIIIQKTSIKAIQIEEELLLPIHIKLPKIEANKN